MNAKAKQTIGEFMAKMDEAYYALQKVYEGERGAKKAAKEARKLLTEMKQSATDVKRATMEIFEE